MQNYMKWGVAAIMMILVVNACAPKNDPLTDDMKKRLAQFDSVTLTTNLDWLSDNEKEIIRILIDAADLMDQVFLDAGLRR
jgi:hypothetical protein